MTRLVGILGMTMTAAMVLVFPGCKDRSSQPVARVKGFSGPVPGLEEFARQNFLLSIHGDLPPIGRAVGVVLTVKLTRFGGYDSHSLDAAVDGLTTRINGQLTAKKAPSYVIVAIDPSGVYAPSAVIASKISSEDLTRRQKAAKATRRDPRALLDVMILTEDRESWYTRQYDIKTDLGMVILGLDGKPVLKCALPGEAGVCLKKFDELAATGRGDENAADTGPHANGDFGNE